MLIITKHHCCPNLRGSDVNGVSAWVFCVTNKIPAENENSGFRTEIFLFYMTFLHFYVSFSNYNCIASKSIQYTKKLHFDFSKCSF